MSPRPAVQFHAQASCRALIVDTTTEEGRAFMRATWGNFTMRIPAKPVGMVEALRQADELSAEMARLKAGGALRPQAQRVAA